eukprot:COSAG01_NODE_10127_length_2243_cov_2.718284_1_plen_48_part_10
MVWTRQKQNSNGVHSEIVDRRDDTCTGGALEAFVDEKAALATFPPPLL